MPPVAPAARAGPPLGRARGGRAAAAPARLAGDAPDRPLGQPRRRGGASKVGAVRLPLPVPRRRREHGQRLVDLEPERDVRVDVRPGVVGASRHPGPDLLHAAAVEPERGRRVADRPRAPQRPGRDDGVLERRTSALPARARDEAGRRPRRAGSLGLPRAGERRRARVRRSRSSGSRCATSSRRT